jgi:hypothetical protein
MESVWPFKTPVCFIVGALAAGPDAGTLEDSNFGISAIISTKCNFLARETQNSDRPSQRPPLLK